jgi:tetratricopeptide (TPR) repeat protein
LSAIFDRRDEKHLSAALLARAAQLLPADDSTRFSAAFALSPIGFGHLSLTLYDCLRKSGFDNSGVLNNLGAQCSEYEMPINATSFFRKAADLGHTLAKANLAFNYLNAGFADEAKDMLDAARKDESPHENVARAIVAMGEHQTDEEGKWREAIACGTKEQIFLSRVVDALSAPNHDKVQSFAGTWQDEDNIEMTLVADETIVRGEFERHYAKTKVTITPYGNAGFCECEETRSYKYGQEFKKGFALLGNQETLELLCIEDKKPVVCRWSRKKNSAIPGIA